MPCGGQPYGLRMRFQRRSHDRLNGPLEAMRCLQCAENRNADEEGAPARGPAFARRVAGADDGYPVPAKIEPDRGMDVCKKHDFRCNGDSGGAEDRATTVQFFEPPALGIEEEGLGGVFAGLFFAYLLFSSR